MNKIIVTGSCGFIGYNLINSLPKNIEIIGIDSLNSAYDNRLKIMRLNNLEKLNNFNFLQLDLSKSDDVESNSKIFEKCDIVFHLGARAGVRQSFKISSKG